jgi:hypothetical protein
MFKFNSYSKFHLSIVGILFTVFCILSIFSYSFNNINAKTKLVMEEMIIIENGEGPHFYLSMYIFSIYNIFLQNFLFHLIRFFLKFKVH